MDNENRHQMTSSSFDSRSSRKSHALSQEDLKHPSWLDEADKPSSSDDDNEFWNNDANLIARCMLSKGRKIYKRARRRAQKAGTVET